MKRYLIICLLILTLPVLAQKWNNKPVHYYKIKSFYTDLNNDSLQDTVIISSSQNDKSIFNKITIKLNGYKAQSFLAKQDWTIFDGEFLKKNKNLINTNLIFISKTEKQAVILLWGGLDGAGYGSEFSIINIENNKAEMVFDPVNDNSAKNIDVEIPCSLTDLEGNGRLCFIYKGIVEFNKILKYGKTGTYTPFFVYPVNSDCKLDKPLTKLYNQQHYVFAGYNYSEQIEIYYPNNGGKPRIWKISKDTE